MKRKKRRIDIMCSIMSVFVVLLFFVFGGVALRLDVVSADPTLGENSENNIITFDTNTIYKKNTIYTTTGGAGTVFYECDGWGSGSSERDEKYFEKGVRFGLIADKTEQGKYYLGPLGEDGNPITEDIRTEPGGTVVTEVGVTVYEDKTENSELEGFMVLVGDGRVGGSRYVLQPVYLDTFNIYSKPTELGAYAKGVDRKALNAEDAIKVETTIDVDSVDSNQESQIKEAVESNIDQFKSSHPNGTTLGLYYSISRKSFVKKEGAGGGEKGGPLSKSVELIFPISKMSNRSDIPVSISVWQLSDDGKNKVTPITESTVSLDSDSSDSRNGKFFHDRNTNELYLYIKDFKNSWLKGGNAVNYAIALNYDNATASKTGRVVKFSLGAGEGGQSSINNLGPFQFYVSGDMTAAEIKDILAAKINAADKERFGGINYDFIELSTNTMKGQGGIIGNATKYEDVDANANDISPNVARNTKELYFYIPYKASDDGGFNDEKLYKLDTDCTLNFSDSTYYKLSGEGTVADDSKTYFAEGWTRFELKDLGDNNYYLGPVDENGTPIATEKHNSSERGKVTTTKGISFSAGLPDRKFIGVRKDWGDGTEANPYIFKPIFVDIKKNESVMVSSPDSDIDGNATVTGLNHEALGVPVGDDELLLGTLKAEEIAEDNVSTELREEVAGISSDGSASRSFYLDMSALYMLLDKNNYEKKTDGQIGKLSKPIEIGIPVSKLNTGSLKDMFVFRKHGNKVSRFETLTARLDNTGSYRDGTCFYDADTGKMYIYSKYFSEYAIVAEYSKAVDTSGTPETTGGTTETTGGTTETTGGTTETTGGTSGNSGGSSTSSGGTSASAAAKKSSITANGMTKKANRIAMREDFGLESKDDKLTVSWGKIKDADKYYVYIRCCGEDFSGKPDMIVENATGVTFAEVDGHPINSAVSYKTVVKAYKTVNNERKYLGSTGLAHIPGAQSRIYTSAKAIRIDSEKSLSLSVGDNSQIKATTVLNNKNKKLFPDEHMSEFRFLSSNNSVATVTDNGRIKAVGKGTCDIYVYAQNGVSDSVGVTIK